jgi:hypothetical protein
MNVRVAVLTVSDEGASGKRADTSGDAIVDWIGAQGYLLSGREMVPDETDLVAAVLLGWADGGVADLIVTTGGTGLGRPVPLWSEKLRGWPRHSESTVVPRHRTRCCLGGSPVSGDRR